MVKRQTANVSCFNTQPPEGGCIIDDCFGYFDSQVSTHSRPKAAAEINLKCTSYWIVSTHSRPKAAAPVNLVSTVRDGGFNTQPPEGGCAVRM